MTLMRGSVIFSSSFHKRTWEGGQFGFAENDNGHKVVMCNEHHKKYPSRLGIPSTGSSEISAITSSIETAHIKKNPKESTKKEKTHTLKKNVVDFHLFCVLI